MGHRVMKQQILQKNEHNLPTYFQIGRNSLEHGERVYVHDPNNRGLSNFSRGKKYNIPVQAAILTKGDSYSNLNLPASPNSPGQKFQAKMRMQERKFKQ